MQKFPPPILEYLQTLTVEKRSPAYLLVDKAGRVCKWGGSLAAYGITDLKKGRAIGEQAFFLEGLLPLDEESIILSCIKTESNLCADLHLFPRLEGDWVLFLDATAEAVQRGLFQQHANDLAFLRRKFRQTASVEDTLFMNLLTALNIAVLDCPGDNTYRIIGTVPDWFAHLHPRAAAKHGGTRPYNEIPFLENFLFDVEEFWQAKRPGVLKSGPWVEQDAAGNEYQLEASALRLGTRKLMLIELLGSEFEEKQAAVQTARETSLSYQRLTQEIQKKDILLHCIVHDLAGPLTVMRGCLELLAGKSLPPSEKEIFDIAIAQAAKQEHMIQDILDVFAAEVHALDAVDSAQALDVARCAQGVVQMLSPIFALSKVQLQLDPQTDWNASWPVVGESARLERILSNLLDNALRHSRRGSVVTIGVTHAGDAVLTTIDDQGPGVLAEQADSLFHKFSRGRGKTGRAGLGLYFCRITVERWGGTIGYTPRPEGGSRFWFRLPHPSDAARSH